MSSTTCIRYPPARSRPRPRLTSTTTVGMRSSATATWWWCLVLLVFVVGVFGSSPRPPPVRRVHHPSRSTMRILPRIRIPAMHARALKTLSPPPSSLRHSDTLLLTSSLPSLFPFDIDMLLRPTEHLFHPQAKITFENAGSASTSIPLRADDWRLYTGHVLRPGQAERKWAEEAAGHGWRHDESVIGDARIMVHDAGGGNVRWEGVFTVNGVNHHVLTREHYDRVKTIHDADIVELDNDMVVFTDVDMWHDTSEIERESAGHMCSHDSLPFNTDPLHPVHRSRRRAIVESGSGIWARDDTGGMTANSNYINSINSSVGCPTTQQIVYMGVALDCNYVTAYGSADAARTQVLNNWNLVTGLYRSTFNISLGIIELVVQNMTCPTTASSDTAWNVGCSNSVTLDQRLSMFSQWRGTRSGDGVGLWHLMSACTTSSEIGVAWLGTLCQTDASYQSGSYVSGTAVSTATTTEWSLISHEIGHGFGAIHDCTTGCSLTGSCCPFTTTTCSASGQFIMNPTTATTETSFSGCTLGNICSNIGNNGITTSCIQTPGTETVISLQQCGNGIVEAGEECDPGSNSTSSCCDSSTCKFVSGAVCDPANSACCTSSCQYSSAGTVCRPAVNSICDIAEVCTGNNATCPADVTTADGTSCGSNGLACASGTCTSLNLQCQTAGASLNLTTACGQRDDTSCIVACKDPTVSNQCVVLETVLIDGSPCGYGGRCYNGTCNSGSFSDTVAAWYKQNLQISIPVTILGALVIITGLVLIGKCIITCVRRNKRKKAVGSIAQAPMYQAGLPPLPPPPPPGMVQNGTVVVPLSNGYDPRPTSQAYPTGWDQQQQLQQYSQHQLYPQQQPQPQPQPQPYQSSRHTRHSGWVDESQYNGPYYGRAEAYGD